MSVVQCRSLSKQYKQVQALDDLSITIEENKIIGLIGRNGAGKTTLLKIIAGYLKPTGGEVRVFSQDPFNNLSVAANLIYINDEMVFPDSFTLSETLTAVGSFYEHWDQALALRLLDYFSLDPRQAHSWLSKGMQSTFNVIVGLASHCPLTIFDEPTTGMDAAVRKDFYRALLKDYMERPRTVILSSHLLNEVENILEELLLLKNGTKRLHLPLTELKEYAVGLRGNAGEIRRILDDSEIIHREAFAPDSIYVVVQNNLSDSQIRELQYGGIVLSSVSAEDLCVYLTAKTEGGIDDVFIRN